MSYTDRKRDRPSEQLTDAPAGIASGTQPPATAQSVRNDIANLLQNPPAPGTSVELDAYVWRGWSDGEGSSWVDHDAQGCPMLSAGTTLLTDQPILWVLP